jgi:lipopolysaccharide biosynthesis glycosyltransferase
VFRAGYFRATAVPISIATPLNVEKGALAVAFDEHYLAPACAMLNSLAQSLQAPDELPVKALMPESTSPTSRQQLASFARRGGLQLETLLAEEDFSMLPVTGPYTRAVYLSLLLPEVLPETQQILYLDVDLIVMRDVSELFGMDLGDLPVAAVQDGFIDGSPAGPKPAVESSGPPRRSPYFNSGVMMINTKVWREERIGPRAMELIRASAPPLRWLDQDALNMLSAGRWTELDPRWNVFTISDQLGASEPDRVAAGHSMADQVRLERDAFILHFAGSQKPWHEDYPRTPNWERYRQFAE